MKDSQHTIILFYKYTHLDNPQEFLDVEKERCKRLGMTGRTIIAAEGINGTYEGTTENIEQYIKEFTADPRFADVSFKKSPGNGKAFPRLSIKLRPELVTLRLEDYDFNPADFTAEHLSPEQLDAWYANKEDFVIIDMRNDYEHAVGHFENSILPPLKRFRDLPKLLPKLEHLKDKKVLTVCTGGVRCEKASGYLLKNGFKEVYQLDGGMVTYMEKYPTKNYRGAMYVFDNRVVMDYDGGQHEIIGVCTGCRAKTENFLDCGYHTCGNQVLRCLDCIDHGNITCSLVCQMKMQLRNLKKNLKLSFKK
ncbi:MAG: rhodanese-related sulfurtransferase [Candidatus Pacebacteria bacterium]|nr:rhodanese-related sulfurtransferase [Candidatus Paceibacterota bacterium]